MVTQVETIAQRKQDPHHRVATLLGILGSFFCGLLASGSLWYALILVFEAPSLMDLPTVVFASFTASIAATLLFVTALLIWKRGSWHYAVPSFLFGGTLSAIIGVLGIALAGWVSSIAATGG